jgi:caspase domain-containing protein
VEIYDGKPFKALMVIGDIDSSTYQAVNVQNNFDTLIDCRNFGSFLRTLSKKELHRSRLFENVEFRVNPQASAWLRLSARLESLTLINNHGASYTAKAMLRVRVEHMPQGNEILSFTLRETGNAPGKSRQFQAALDPLAINLAASLSRHLSASATAKKYVADHPELHATSTLTASHGQLEVAPQVDDSETKSAIDTTSIDFGSYHALVIGINQYTQLPRLRNAVNDVRAVADLLKQSYNFQVNLLINPKRVEILKALGDLRRSLTYSDNLLIYYAGHGWLDMDADQGYWLPTDAAEDNKSNWVSNTDITSEIRAMLPKHIMIVADSCYSGKLVRGLHIKHKAPDYIARMSQKKARVVLTSGGIEPVADSFGSEIHSVFANAFIRALHENANVMDGVTLFKKIRRPVMINSDQTPEYSDIHKAGHDGGDFIFVRTK